ncbi:GGDEF domain-containing response regulator [Salidesulfovibrio onnuriiensis]|uniref:GGDEF domain-containing response regulator n=1 Tax=Salidesulfovibrio onnuriiensis TaxID=2583823 RepID=UPI0011CAA2E8|nr:diguanylate cyclase [Salidesulfovibrio onnuriiensis]
MSPTELKVLVVDDSQANLVLMDHLISQEDCVVYQARNGLEAIELVKRHQFALILLDIQMPELNGYETALAIKDLDNGRHVPIIFITAIFQDQDNVKQGYASGAVDYLFRPVDVQTLKSKVQIFLQMHQQKVLLQREIEERTRAQQALREAEEKYRSIFERAVEGIFQCTVDGTFLEANPALLHILGYESVGQVVGIPGISNMIMFDGEQRQRYLSNLRRDGYVSNYEYKGRKRNGEIVWLSESSRLVEAADGTEIVEGVVEDITRRKRQEQELRHLATMDSLTGVPNRHVFFDRLEHAVESAKRYGTLLAVLFVDLDEFKKVNDTYGHSAGDKLLQAVAERCQKRVRAADTFARIGGDEFGVLLERVEDVDNVSSVAREILDAVGKPFAVDDMEMAVGATIGISLYPQDGEDAVSLLAKADSAMYSSKNKGREKFAFHSSILQ